jgi:hypothetical protein
LTLMLVTAGAYFWEREKGEREREMKVERGGGGRRLVSENERERKKERVREKKDYNREGNNESERESSRRLEKKEAIFLLRMKKSAEKNFQYFFLNKKASRTHGGRCGTCGVRLDCHPCCC